MKRFISLLLIVVLFVSFGACSKNNNESVLFYYLKTDFKFGTDQTIITPEKRDAAGHYNQYDKLMEAYLSGPIDSAYSSPFPSGTSLISLEINNTRAHIVVSSHLATLSGHKLTIACACIGKTLLEMVDVRSVEIKAQDSLLNGMQSVILSENDLFLWDNNVGE